MAYTRVKDWARRKLILREWLLLANHSRAAKVHESLVQVNGGAGVRVGVRA